MPRAGVDERDFIVLAHWFVREVGPRLSAWVDGEGVKVEARALQARANRARAIGEVDDHVHAFLIMSTAQALRWCWAEGLGVSGRAWVKPDGEVVQAPNGHVQWVTENMDNLIAQGLAPQDPAKRTPQATSISLMMDQGWVRYSGGQITSPKGMPSAAQVAALDGLIKQVGAPAGFSIDLLIGKQFLSVPASEVEAQGLEAVLSRIGTEHRADMGGGTDGPQQQGDGCDVGHNFMETVQDGSTAPFERSYRYMKQDWQPEVWWSRQLLDYLSHNFPGKKDVSGPEPDAGSIPSATGPGQQFASSVRIVLEASRRQADASNEDWESQMRSEEEMAEAELKSSEDPGDYGVFMGMSAMKRAMPLLQSGKLSMSAYNLLGSAVEAMAAGKTGDQFVGERIELMSWEYTEDGEKLGPNPNARRHETIIHRDVEQLKNLGLWPWGMIKASFQKQADATDPSDTDGQHDQLNEDSTSTHLLDPASVLYKKQRGLGAPMGDPGGGGDGEMRTRLGQRWFRRKSDKALEQQIIQMEKDHLEPQQITRELREDGVPTQVIDETYDNRDKNLVKVVEVTI